MKNNLGFSMIPAANQFVVFLCLFFCLPLFAEAIQGTHQKYFYNSESHFVSKQWTTDNGLPVNNINQVYQTPDGFIWLATFNGLIRFDGINFREFNPGNSPGLPSNRILAIQPGIGNSFWINTEQGHLVLFENGTFRTFESQFLTENETFTINNRTQVKINNNRTWISTNSGLFIYQNHELESFRADLFTGNGFFDNRNRSTIDIGMDHIVRVFDAEGVVWEIDPNLDVTKTIQIPEIRGASTVMQDRFGTYWIAKNQMARLSQNNYRLLPNPLDKEKDGRNIHSYYKSFQENPDGSIMVMSLNGLLKIENDSLLVLDQIEIQNHGSFPEMLGNSFTTCTDSSVWAIVQDRIYKNGKFIFRAAAEGETIYCDLEMNLWIPTTRDGLFRYRRSPLDNITFQHSINNFYGVYLDSYNTYWVGGFFSDLTQVGSDGVIYEFVSRRGLGTTASFFEASDGALWNGYHRCIPENRSTTGACLDFEPVAELHGKNVFSVYEDSEKRMWFGTNGGLYRLAKGNVEEVSFPANNTERPVRYILETADSALWMATNGAGIFRYQYGESFAYTRNQGLTSNNIRSLFEDEEGFIWIATEDMGLNRLDPLTGDVAVIKKNDGLFEDGLHNMLLDDFGRMWFSSNQGIFWVQFDHLQQFANGKRNRVHSQFYNERDGMLNREANGGFQNSGFKSNDGRIFFATQNGIVVIDPSQIDTQTTIQPVLLDDFIVGGESIYSGVAETNLANNQRSFTIQFTAPFFTAPDRIRYRYKLNGFDDVWIDAGSRREAIYTNVPAGTYQFSVTASLGNEESTSIETTHAVVISPYFYETTWFSIVIFLLFVLLIGGGYRLRVRQLIKKEKILENIVAMKTDDLRSEKIKTEEQAEQLRILYEQLRILFKEKNRFFVNISHEFRTPLTMINGQIETLIDSESDRNKKMRLNSVYNNSEKLLSLINQLLDLSKLEEGKMELHPEKANIISFLKSHFFSFESLAQAENISLYFSSARDNIVVNYDADKMEKVFFNLFSNACKFSEPGGRIDVAVEIPQPDIVEIRVKDSGIGISKDSLPYIFDRFYQADSSKTRKYEGSGIGLALAFELITLHNGTIDVTSKEGVGSEFIIRLPYQEDLVPDTQGTALNKQVNSEAVLPVTALPDFDTILSDNDELILIVEDNTDVRTFIREQLKHEYKILEAVNGREGIAISQDTIPDLIITDLMMPEMDGYEFSIKIRRDEKTSHIPIIMLTAKTGQDPKIEGLEAGIDAYLTKPFHVKELQAKIKALIQQRKSLKEQFSTSTFFKPSVVAKSSIDQSFIRKAVEMIDNHISEDNYLVEDYAKSLNMSVSQLNRKLNALVDQSASTFIRSVKLHRAAKLINQTDKTIAEICYEVGFQNHAYFSRSFKNHFGKSPSAFRKLPN